MSDAPERIWATVDVDVSAQIIDVYAQASPDGFVGHPVEYRCADLPPTLAQAMMVPEVRELVEAAKALLEAHESGWAAGKDWGAAERTRAALRRIDGNPS
jgi:hypothetical protein